MITTNLYLDQRRKGAEEYSLRISIARHQQTAYIQTGIKLSPKDWDSKKRKVIRRGDKTALNAIITDKLRKVQTIVSEMENNGELHQLSTIQIRNKVLAVLDGKKGGSPNFAEISSLYKKGKSEGTQQLIDLTLARMIAFTPEARNMNVDDITPLWLQKFDEFMAKTAKINSRAIHMRNIRAVINFAINNEMTENYPFRKFRIKTEPTRKRALPVEQLRLLFNYKVEPHLQRYIDIFKLIFLLIGINIKDLCFLRKTTANRIEYKRAKTGRLYSVKIEPEAQEIINKYKGTDYLLCFLDEERNYKWFANRVNFVMKNKIGRYDIVGKHGKRIYKELPFSEITTYWMRHSWATIAAQLDIPRDTISHALGHGNNTVTDIYIDFDQTKVDEANRRVIDYVMYNEE